MTMREKITALLESGDADAIVREIPTLITSTNRKEEIESILSNYFLDERSNIRSNAAMAIYAMTHAELGGVSTADNIKRSSVRPTTLERLIAAVVVESEAKVRAEQLCALL